LVVNNRSLISGLDGDDYAHLGYLLLLVVFVGSALAGRGLRAGEVVRSIFAWSLILVILVGAYAYRTELVGVGGRILGVLAPGVPIAGSLLGDGDPGSVVIIRANDGHFAVRTAVDDVPLMLLVDTGASFVTLTMADAAGIGIDLRRLRFVTPIRTANGVIQAAPITLRNVSVGTIERRNVAALVAPPNSLDQSLLGMSFLDTLNGYGISGDRLMLTP
jgi:aspartyl protease family protein